MLYKIKFDMSSRQTKLNAKLHVCMRLTLIDTKIMHAYAPLPEIE
jgi:hypothetical protein